ncbi:MAG: nicotinate (nicotinamide) nucleotide adenylyltransferase [Caldisericia bacterium]|nr:nicotinate (nicotinamide) nucleotide adenylyltransferase [Caldisericia bacterium]
MSRIGILGGSFNPPTYAHLQLGIFSKSQYQLEKILVVPCSVSGFYKNSELVSETHRYNMTCLAVQNFKDFEVLDIELFKGKPVYAFESLAEIKKQYPDDDLFYISGSDSLVTIDRWKNPDQVVGSASFIVAERGNVKIDQIVSVFEKLSADKKKIHRLEFPRNDLSSTLVRERLSEGFGNDCLIPSNVLEYIMLHDLYQKGG